MGVIQNSINQGLAMASVLGRMHGISNYKKEQTEKIRKQFKSNIINYQKEYADFANSLASLQKQQANKQKIQVKKHKFDKDIIGGMYE